jgi:imidazolonepropionase-like amidohydrolase
MTRYRILGLALVFCGAAAGSAMAESLSYVVLANGEKVGHLSADVEGSTAKIDYSVVNNGRGPKARETLQFDAAGVPISWTIEGSSLFGSPVKEHFAWAKGVAQWESQPDKGKVKAPTAPFYVPADASPWIQSQFARALIKAPGHRLPVLPSGTMRLEEVRKLTLGEGAKALPLTVYELSGIDLSSSYVVLDDKGDLFALPDEGVVREGYEAEFKQLQATTRDLALDQAEAAQTKLAHHFTTPVRIRNVRIFDPKTMTVGGPSQVVFYGEKIGSIEPETSGTPNPKGETVIDGQGGTLVPGLHDMHHHVSLQSNLMNLAAGVTAIREMGNDNQTLLTWNKLIDEGKLPGPRIVRNGFLEGRSPYSARNGFIADTLDQALEDVRWYADHGYWQIKIYNSFNPDWVAPVAAEAHRLGMGVTGHVPAFSSPDRVLKDGYNDIAHVNQLMLGWILSPGEDTRTPLRLTGMARGHDLDLGSDKVKATIALMKEKNAKLDTTAVILERLMMSRSGQINPGDAPYLSHVPIGYQRYRKRGFVTLDHPGDEEAYAGGYQKVLDVLKLLDDNGVELMPGTDDNTGFTLHRELEIYVQAGIPAAKTLRLATLDPEIYFGRDQQLGTIERGKLADFILVDGDPTKDIRRIRQVRMTVRGGVVYYPAEIYDHLSIKPFAAPPPVTPAN